MGQPGRYPSPAGLSVACCRLGSVAPASVRIGGLAWAGPSAGKSRGYRVELSVLVSCWPCLQLASCCPIDPSKSQGPAQSPGQVRGLPSKWGTCEFQRREQGQEKGRSGALVCTVTDCSKCEVQSC